MPILLFNNFYLHTGFITYLACITLFVLATQSKKPIFLLKYLVTCAFVVSVVAVGQFFGLFLFIPHVGIAAGTMGNPNFLGTYSVFILPIAIMFFLRYQNTFWLICTALIYSALLVSLTRGAWIAFFLSLIIIFFFYVRVKSKHRSLTLVIIILMILTYCLTMTQDGLILNRASSVSGELVSGIMLEDNAGSGRILCWKETIKLLPDHWAFGMGPDHLIYAKIMINNKIISKAHNIFLEIAITIGLFALAFYIAFLTNFIRRWDTEIERIFPWQF